MSAQDEFWRERFATSLHQEETTQLALNNPKIPNPERITLAKTLASLTPLCNEIRSYNNLTQQKISAQNILAEEPDADLDLSKELKALASEEIITLEKQRASILDKIQNLMLDSSEEEINTAILEIRPGTGGEEAALFAADLLTMYQRYSANNSYKFETISIQQTQQGGIKEAIATIEGPRAFTRLSVESGVHRVQRIPETETQGRIHTSAATVAILPQTSNIQHPLREQDLRTETFRAQGAGGQHVNTTDSAVRITHIPSGQVVQCQDEKSQHRNREKALKVLTARVQQHIQESQNAERSATRNAQIGSGDRSERIRTYNFPQNRITDHRIALTIYKLDRIMQGDGLELLLNPLEAARKSERITQLQEQNTIPKTNPSSPNKQTNKKNASS